MALTLKFSDAIVEMNFSVDVKKDWLIGDEMPQFRNPCNAEQIKSKSLKHRGTEITEKTGRVLQIAKVSAAKMSQIHLPRPLFTGNQRRISRRSAEKVDGRK